MQDQMTATSSEQKQRQCIKNISIKLLFISTSINNNSNIKNQCTFESANILGILKEVSSVQLRFVFVLSWPFLCGVLRCSCRWVWLGPLSMFLVVSTSLTILSKPMLVIAFCWRLQVWLWHSKLMDCWTSSSSRSTSLLISSVVLWWEAKCP